ncbi:P-loop containing nucleoside triphosphate hydrolase protein [Collybia nuda]|uniref:P-loop containing nucleoside triphosphate hydrolase protein n=1 Tax=Collybia nuda TaxID=64659 RepID=A0A9P5Y740_9AGAR|nr:P-loop containing nucleoside triphosphate hydrolase protein [Collybia nuda]
MFGFLAVALVGGIVERDKRDRARRRAQREAEEARQRAVEAEAQRVRAAHAAAEAERQAREAAEAQRRAAQQAEQERRRAEAEAERRRHADEEAAAAQRAWEAAEEARKQADELWRSGIPPEFVPTREEIDRMRAKHSYVQGLRHFAIVGLSGTGKSSLINAFRGLANYDPGAATTGVNETTTDTTRYPDSSHGQCVWYDVPGAGTLTVSEWQYFKDRALYVFDALIVVFGDRFTMTDIAILKTCKACKIPTLIVRSKSDQYTRSIRHDAGYETDPDDYSTRFSTPFLHAEEQARALLIQKTREAVRDNLAQAGLPQQRVYIVSKATMLQQVKNETVGARIDEFELHRDVLEITNGTYRI